MTADSVVRGASGPYIVKDPDAVLDYEFDWSDWLNGDTIASATVTVGSGATKVAQVNDTSSVTAWISGGTAGTSVNVTCHVVTAAGREDDRTLSLVIKDR